MSFVVSEETRPLLADVREGREDVDNHGATNSKQTEKRKPTPLPKVQIGILMLLHLAEPITSNCIFPFINQLVSELDITGGDEKKVGYYAGMIESIFFATEALFVFQWSRLSDHIGRKPVLLVGVGGLAISMVCFGLSKTFLSLVVSRSLVGMLNGNTGVMKSMMGELTDSTNIAQGFASIPVAWATGATIGPLIGGQLAKPHDRWPNLFSHPFWIKYPYFLPCGTAAAFSAILTRPVVTSIINYGVLALIEIGFIALMPLFFSTPIELGGLGLSPPTIGLILGSLGLLDGIFQALFFAKAVDVLGPKRTFQLGLSTFVPLYALFPVMSLYAKAHGVDNVIWGLVFVQMALIVVMDLSFGAIFIFITSSVPSNRSLGAVNGVAQFVASVMRAFGPAASTSLFATSLERNWLGGYAVYVFLIVAAFTLFFASTVLPLELWPRHEPQEESS
ncbi:MFS general substrate transporter [Lentinus tigrinus ALCF2SS1-7]|uniref:MFS general substrate transporter n=1 Tax=Lentinus tigrinus ALCF2SS1-6 TaxID=1328759 RepID=A0A5C2S301_9APHY|nr:MFS general substrate transporter [Lentinus tigrinus ALCF2SS1-6]RPD70433.1 MFS general substrate transporter [Lentinus tigrinus ALCF2SS1-7]